MAKALLMRYVLKSLILSLFCLSCNASLFAGTANISGSVYQAEAVALRFDPYFLGEQITELNSEEVGTEFNFDIEVGDGGLVDLVCLGKALTVYLEPGDELKVDISEGDNGPVYAFEGKGSANNKLWRDFVSEFRNDEVLAEYEGNLAMNGVDVWEFWLYDQRKKSWDFYKEHPSKGLISQGFKDLIEAEIKYDYHSNILAYSVEKAKTSAKTTFTPLPHIMLEDINEKMVNREKGMVSPAYRLFIERFVYYLSADLNNFNKFVDATESLEAKYTSASGVVPEMAMNYVVAKYIYDNCTKISSSIARKYVLLLSKGAVPAYGDIVKEECGSWLSKPDPKEEAALAEKASRGKKAKSQPFILNDMSGEKVYLGDYEGKVIYVDFWASWCGPCRGQFPFAKKMKEQLSKKEKEQIVFLYISIDNNEAAWKKGIERAGVDGVHLFSPGGWGASVCNYFSIQSIPRYMIIDKKGEVVNPNAPRPQDPKALEELLQLVKRKK